MSLEEDESRFEICINFKKIIKFRHVVACSYIVVNGKCIRSPEIQGKCFLSV